MLHLHDTEDKMVLYKQKENHPQKINTAIMLSADEHGDILLHFS